MPSLPHARSDSRVISSFPGAITTTAARTASVRYHRLHAAGHTCGHALAPLQIVDSEHSDLQDRLVLPQPALAEAAHRCDVGVLPQLSLDVQCRHLQQRSPLGHKPECEGQAWGDKLDLEAPCLQDVHTGPSLDAAGAGMSHRIRR